MKLRNPNSRQTVSGPFAAQIVRPGVWQFTSEVGSGAEILLLGVGPEAPELLAQVSRLSVDWRTDGVLVTLTAADGVYHLNARSALIHQAQVRLYESLPLASFDAAAQRFWRRVFRVIRIPGGRWILAIMARRKPGVASQ